MSLFDLRRNASLGESSIGVCGDRPHHAAGCGRSSTDDRCSQKNGYSDTISDWVEFGAREGNPKDAPPLVDWSTRTTTSSPIPNTEANRILIHAATPPPTLQGDGRNFALVIGNNNYRDLPRLSTAVSDAEAIEQILNTQYGFQVEHLLDATREQILRALNTYRRTLPSDASLLIYYAGHGYNDRDVDKAYWLPIDAQADQNTNWISADDVTTDIRGHSRATDSGGF